MSAPESLTVAGRRRHARAVLADQAADVRRGEEVPGRLPDPRRPAGRLGRRLVGPLEPDALGGAGLGRRARRTRAARRASARSSWTRSRSDWGGKVMTDLDAVFDAVVKLPYVDATKQGIAGASYGGYAVDWILGHTNRFKAAVTHDGVFNLESMSLVDRGAVVLGVGVRRLAVERGRAQAVREVVAAPVRAEHQDADAHHHERARLPRARRPGSAAVHGAARQRRPGRGARLPGRRATGCSSRSTASGGTRPCSAG